MTFTQDDLKKAKIWCDDVQPICALGCEAAEESVELLSRALAELEQARRVLKEWQRFEQLIDCGCEECMAEADSLDVPMHNRTDAIIGRYGAVCAAEGGR